MTVEAFRLSHELGMPVLVRSPTASPICAGWWNWAR